MHILITNDDGVTAPGLAALAGVLKERFEITILAPDRNWSASGHVKTMHRPLRVLTARLEDGTSALACDGAPSDCVALALLGLVEKPIDLVVSGINPNANLGHDVTYSGTVTAAMEAAIAGIPGLAFSLDGAAHGTEPLDFGAAASVAGELVSQLTDQILPADLLLNINIPYRPRNEIRGVTLTRQGQRVYRDELVRRDDPKGRPYYWIGGEAPTGVSEPGTDFWALQEGWVSITPLKLDLTATEVKKPLEDWNLQLD